MTTLENRPNTALLVIDVQNGVVRGLIDATRSSRTSAAWSKRRDGKGSRWSGSSTPTSSLPRGSDEWRIVPELTPERRRAARREELRRRVRGHDARDRAVGPRSRATRRRRAADRCVHPLDAPRRVRQGVRRDPCQRRPHDRGPHGMGGTAAGPGHRTHEPVLEVPDGSGADGGSGRDQGCRLRRHNLTPT